MKKILAISWKDLRILFRDYVSWIMMLAAPMILTLGMGLITGTLFSDDEVGISDIPVVFVNMDEGDLGALLAESFEEPGIGDLFMVSTSEDENDVRQRVDGADFAAAVIIPAGFTTGVIPDLNTGIAGEPVPIVIYADPGQPISVGVVTSVVTSFINEVETLVVGGKVTVTQLVENNLISLQDRARTAEETVGSMLQQGNTQLIVLSSSDMSISEEESFNPLIGFASGMAVFFLMYTVTIGGRSILQERNMGTLSRMMVSPTRTGQILGGKVLGIFLTGFMQVAVLILATTLLLDIPWGDPLGVALLIAATAAAATGWGIVLAAFATTAAQVASLGLALMLIFGILGGSFTGVPDSGLWSTLSKITPHAWAIDGMEKLAGGGSVIDVVTHIAVLLSMTAVLFVVAIIAFQRSQRTRN
jgi:ABC-2 type transport system permease protein